ncbi:MAG: hypothetical protein QOF27_1500 [Gaiellaceae bacterium]|jgi:diguanylate cyclase (GGDEF)-like protein|nr:hypothetical protein [Gaiellaceae bacterium]
MDRDELTGLRLRPLLDPGVTCRAMIAIDVDYMKAFNDHAGHESGDAALRDIAGVIRDTAGDEFTYRVGGEEFLIVLPNSWDGDENVLAERVRAAALVAVRRRPIRTPLGTETSTQTGARAPGTRQPRPSVSDVRALTTVATPSPTRC